MDDRLHTFLLAGAITSGALDDATAAAIFMVVAVINLILAVWATREVE
jgi:ABC-type polysaccharide transport system permease subunit